MKNLLFIIICIFSFGCGIQKNTPDGNESLKADSTFVVSDSLPIDSIRDLKKRKENEIS